MNYILIKLAHFVILLAKFGAGFRSLGISYMPEVPQELL